MWRDDAFGFSAYRDVLVSSRQWALLIGSVGLAFAVALFATLLGAGAGFALENVPRRARTPLIFLLTMPVVVPQHIMAIAWVDVLGRSGYLSRFVQIALPGAPPTPSPFNLAGALFILALTTYPVPMLATVAGMRRFDVRYIEAAQLAGQSGRAFRCVTLPLVLPSILTAALIVFALSISTFAVPSLLQVNTYPVEIHASSLTFDYGAAAAQSLPLIAVCAIALCAWSRYVRPRHAWLSGSGRTGKVSSATAAHALPMFYLIAVACAALLLPLLALFARSLPLRTYTSVWATARDEIVTGLLVAGASATPYTLVCLAYATRESRLRGFVRYTALFAFVIPGPLFALGMIAQWNRPGLPGAVYDSAAILVFACVARFFALGDAAFRAQQARLNPRLIEAASVAGVRWWRALLGIDLPLSLPYLLGVWVIAFVLALGEVDSAVLLSPRHWHLRRALVSLMHYGPDSFVAALSLTTAVGVGVLGLCGFIDFARYRGGSMPALEVKAICKSFDARRVLDRVSLDVESGTALALVGPSGCGKTTLLRIVAGLEREDDGEVWIGGACVSSQRIHVPPG